MMDEEHIVLVPESGAPNARRAIRTSVLAERPWHNNVKYGRIAIRLGR